MPRHRLLREVSEGAYSVPGKRRILALFLPGTRSFLSVAPYYTAWKSSCQTRMRVSYTTFDLRLPGLFPGKTRYPRNTTVYGTNDSDLHFTSLTVPSLPSGSLLGHCYSLRYLADGALMPFPAFSVFLSRRTLCFLLLTLAVSAAASFLPGGLSIYSSVHIYHGGYLLDNPTLCFRSKEDQRRFAPPANSDMPPPPFQCPFLFFTTVKTRSRRRDFLHLPTPSRGYHAQGTALCRSDHSFTLTLPVELFLGRAFSLQFSSGPPPTFRPVKRLIRFRDPILFFSGSFFASS